MEDGSDNYLRIERICNIAGLSCEEDNRGYLIFKDVPIARNGVYQYYGCELGRNSEPNKQFRVYRDEATYNTEECQRSLENIPVTDDHPNVDVDNKNYSVLEKGHTEGKPYFKNGQLIVPKVVIKDAELQTKIKRGKREVSIGFLGYYNWGNVPNHLTESVDGTEHVHSINHLAVVEKGKAGPQFRFNKEHQLENIKDVEYMDTENLKTAMKEILEPIANKLNNLEDQGQLSAARLSNLESEQMEEKTKAKTENEMDAGSVNPMNTGEGSEDTAEKELLDMAYPSTRKIVTNNAKALAALNNAISQVNASNEEMAKMQEMEQSDMPKDEEKEANESENCHNALKHLNNAFQCITSAKKIMDSMKPAHVTCNEDFSEACESVINASENLEDITNDSNISRASARLARQTSRLECTRNVLSPQAPQSAKEGHRGSDKEHREYLTRGVNEDYQKQDPLLELNRPKGKNMTNNEVAIDFSLGDESPYGVPSGFMDSSVTRALNAKGRVRKDEVGALVFHKMANTGHGVNIKSFDIGGSSEKDSFLKS